MSVQRIYSKITIQP